MKLNVPYYSQRLDVRRRFWKSRSCGIVALKMAMDYLGQKKKSYVIEPADNLINKGVSFWGHSLKYGWFHDALLKIAWNKGFKKSLRKECDEAGKKNLLQYIVVNLKKGIPVLVSLRIGESGHLVLLVGFSTKGFFYHDPDSKIRSKGRFKFVSFKKFLLKWKGRIIVIK